MNTLSVNIAEATTAIKTLGSIDTILLRGQPGIGKSTILKTLARQMPDYQPVYIDVATLDLGDLGMPVIDRDLMVTEYAPSARFGLQRGNNRPLLIMLDELGKASSKGVLNMLLPLILERRFGDVPLPTGSIVFATTNLDTDGVGDNLPAHAYDRMDVMTMRNPSADEWIEWAMDSGIVPEVMAFAKQFPQIFQCYTDLNEHERNPYIFNPLVGNTRNFCSPRGLARASNIVAARKELGAAYLPALAGAIGEAAARDLDAMVDLADQLPSFERIVKAPTTTMTPESPGALFVMVFMLASRVSADSIDPVMQYVDRLSQTSFEAYSLFMMTVASNPRTVGFACRNQMFSSGAAKIGKYF